MAEERIELLAPSPSQPLSPPVALLPRDAISVILCSLLVPERLRTASRVCKHWRRIVLASFTSIRLHTEAATGPHLNAALALLPSLRHLKLRKSDSSPVVLRLPASLSSLSLCGSVSLSRDRLTIDSSGCAALTSLSVHTINDVSAVAKLIEATAGTLCTLSLRFDGETSKDLAPKLNTIRFTSLASLHLAAETGVFIDAIFCKWHTQLRHLMTNDPLFSSVDEPFYTALCAAVPPMMHPSLTHLELLGRGWKMAEAALGELVRRAPNLPLSAALLELAAPLLTSIWTLPRESAALSPSHLTHTFTRLTSIHHLQLTSLTAPGKEMLAFIASSQRHALMLHSASIFNGTPGPLQTALVHCTELRKLRIGTVYVHTLTAFPLPSPTTLPHLRKVELANLECPVETVCAVMVQICAVCPNLTRLTVRSFRGAEAAKDALTSACRPLMIRVKI